MVTLRRLWYRFVNLDHLGGEIRPNRTWMRFITLPDDLYSYDSTTDLDGERLSENV